MHPARCLTIAAVLTIPIAAAAQTFPTQDPVIRRMWEVGIVNSQTEQLAHVLMDRIGPRLAGTPGLAAAQDWLVELYESWGVTARKEQYGTWNGWRAGILHVDMVEPRIQTLEAELLAWSPASNGMIEGEVVMPPMGLTRETGHDWLGTVRGKFVLMGTPQPMCRAPQELQRYARPETIARLGRQRTALRREWQARTDSLAARFQAQAAVDSAGALGILTSNWSGGWGVNKIFSTNNQNGVGLDLSCEDYGLLYRLLAGGATPTIRVHAQAEDLGEVPQFNVIAELRGNELPDEYVLLGAHLDSWHGATGATDNGTGTITMLEAMRILKETYPQPRRTILIGHWGAEEMGTIGSGSFREDHPDVMEGMQLVFNQDNGTWRFEIIEGQGYQNAGSHFTRWMGVVPTEMSEHITLDFPGPQNNRGSDHTSFVCAGVPAFRLQSPYDEYRQYTWHTNRDTYDKIVFDDLKENATLAAMLAYLASEDPERMSREKATLPINARTGEPREWRDCSSPRRTPRR